MRPVKPRRLTSDEVALWRAVAETVERHAGSVLPEAPQAAAAAPRASRTQAAPLPASVELKVRRRPAPPPLTDLDRRTRAKIARGRLGIERSIDLHGLAQADAHAVLRRFLHAAHAEDLRLVLVVTGKGERSLASDGLSGSPGVLKRMVPHWLRELDLRTIVLGFETAGVPHGGGGALYIRLRRRRPVP